MPRAATSARPDRKVTDFFGKKTKIRLRPGQPIYDLSMSSERQSIIIMSSDEVPVPIPISNSVDTMRVPNGTTRASPRLRGGAYSKVESLSSSRLSETHLAPISKSSSGLVKLRSRNTATPSVTSIQSATATSSMPRKNAKKRKQQPSNLISSEESDGPVLPSIHVKLSFKKNVRESKSTQDDPPYISPVIPLTPRQNLLSPSNCFPPDTHVVSLPSMPLTKPAVQQLKNGISTVPGHNRPSPSKRPRHDSAASDKLKPSAPGFDADDESEDQVEASPESPDRKASPSGHDQQLEVDNAMKSDGIHMNVDLTVPPSSPGSTGGVREDRINESDHGNVLESLLGSTGHPRKEIQEVLPSSQQGETELLIDDSRMGVEGGGNAELSFIPAISTVSPSKARTDDIIARIKAKAEANAAAQAQDERLQSSLGLLGSEASDLSSLSSISTDEDEDEAELELELSMFGKYNLKPTDSSTTSSHVRSRTPPKLGTRRSTRHVDLPAPNYAKKLQLFRKSTPPPGRGSYDVDEKVNNKGKMTEACPLDMLLRDCEREGARKARVETKRKGTVPNALDSDPALDRDSSVLETPECGHRHADTESPGCDGSSPQDGNIFRDVLLGTVAREELLGKEGADAVGKILDSDRKTKSVIEEKENGVTFWRETNVEGDDDDVVPQLMITDQSPPFLTVLNDAVNRKDYAVASLLVDSGALASVPFSVQLLDWLFATAMSTANHDISQSAYRALMVLHREVWSTEVVACAQLCSTRLLVTLFKLGVSAQVTKLFRTDGVGMVSFVGMSSELKAERLHRFLSVVEVLGRSQRIDPMGIPSIVAALLLLSLDRSTAPELWQDAISAIEAVLASPNVTRNVELDTCKFVLRATKDLAFTRDLQARLLALLPGCSHTSGRVRRQIAWAMLGGDLESIQDSADAPPIQFMVDLFSKTSASEMKLEVTPDTDYEQLGAIVGILSVAMTDVDAYVRLANGSALVRNLYEALEHMNGKIVDTRAAHIDRTRTKEAINRLHKRLVYQRHATLETMRTKTGKMDQFLVAKAKLVVKPKSADADESEIPVEDS